MLKLLEIYEQLNRGRQRCLVWNSDTKKTKRMFYHHFIWISNNGPFEKGWVVHHIDENKLNNDISNLQLLTKTEHDALHMKKRWKNTEFREKQKKSIKQLWQEPEYREKTIRKGWHHTEESKRKISESQKGCTLPEEQKDKISQASKNLWQNEEYRERQMAVRKIAAEKVRGQKRTPEQKERMRLAALKRYNKI